MKIKEITSWCGFDTETTGLDAHNNKILEYGMIRVRDDKIVDTFKVLANHNVFIPQFLTDIHGLTQEICSRDGIDPKLACSQAMDFMGDDIIVGLNNVAFDYMFLEVECNRHSLPRPNIERWFDTGIWHKGIHIGNIYNEEELFFKWSNRVRDIRAKGVKFNLNHLTKVYGCENLREDGLHGSIKDLTMTFNIFNKMKEKYCAN